MVSGGSEINLTTMTRVVSRVLTPIVQLAFIRDQALRLTNGNAEDAFLTTAIGAATEYAELYMERALADQTLQYLLDQFPARILRLPFPPFISLGALSYLDQSGASIDVDAASLRIMPSGRASKAALLPMAGSSFPIASGGAGSVVIEYRAGYQDAAQIPISIQQAIALIVGELYKQRSDSVIGASMTPALLRSHDLMNGWKVY